MRDKGIAPKRRSYRGGPPRLSLRFAARSPPMRLIALALLLTSTMTAHAEDTPAKPVALVIHGGAGVIDRDKLSAEDEKAIRADLDRALDAGHRVLEDNGSALD